jgi:hypothetical protein
MRQVLSDRFRAVNLYQPSPGPPNHPSGRGYSDRSRVSFTKRYTAGSLDARDPATLITSIRCSSQISSGVPTRPVQMTWRTLFWIMVVRLNLMDLPVHLLPPVEGGFNLTVGTTHLLTAA